MHRMILGVITGTLTVGMAVGFSQNPDRIADRKENQQDRIAQGVKNGTLSPSETAHLETQEAKLNKEVHKDRKQNGGNLTNKQKAQINRQQNHLSNAIYRDKHDGKSK